MIPFIACVEEVGSDKIPTGRELKKAYEWPLIPPAGDIVGVGGNLYPDYQVIHIFDRNPPTIEMVLQWSESDFKMLSEDISWKRVFWRD